MIESTVRTFIDELDHLGRKRDNAWQIPREEGELLHQIALAQRAKLVVEVGTSYGFSGLFWAAAVQQTGGHLHTIDQDPDKYDSAKLTFQKAGVSDHVTNHLGEARQVLEVLAGEIDIVFLDADKAATLEYFEIVWPKMRVGGSVIIDNALTHRKELSEQIATIRRRDGLSSCEVAVGNGIEWAVKLAT